MDFATSTPKVRLLEPVPYVEEGRQMVILRDPERFSEKVLTVSLAAYWVVCLLNGHNTPTRIAESFQNTFNQTITLSDLDALLKMLDEALFMDNENFRLHRDEMIRSFVASPVRQAALAGKSYPENPDELLAELDEHLKGRTSPETAPFALVAPHIDLRVGGSAFGAAYASLANSTAETFVILATGHNLAGDFFSVTDKDFETPLGVVPTDRLFLNDLQEAFGEPIYEEAFAHRNEHSVEFQVLYLQKLFADRPVPPKIVPILLSFPETVGEADDPHFNAPRIARFSNALAKCIDARKGKVSLIAGIDLAHVGRRFGQAEGAGEEKQKMIEADDRKLMDLVAARDKKQWLSLMKEINPQNHVCGFPVLYLLLDLLDGYEGRLLDYGQSVEGDGDSMVSFAAMSF